MFEEGIQEFWAWWNETGREALLGAVAGDESDIADVITERVADLHSSLEWQLAPMPGGKYVFALSGGGSRMSRVLTEQAMRWAPVDDDRFMYSPARVPVPVEPFEFGDGVIDPATVLVATTPDDEYEQLDIEMYIPGVDDDQDGKELAMYLLDAVLGEDDTERWVGIIDVVDAAPSRGIPVADLPRLIADYAPTISGEGWTMFERSLSRNEPIVIGMNVGAKHIDHLNHGLHLEVRISLTEVTDMGMPSDAERERVEVIEDAIFEQLGSDVLLLARETGLNLRTLHMYGTDPDEMEAAMESFANHPTHDIESAITLDPDWSQLSQLV